MWRMEAKIAKYHYFLKLFFEIISVLPLFEKYLAIYHFFETLVCETWVWHETQVYENRVS